jgi:hypothetical protein
MSTLSSYCSVVTDGIPAATYSADALAKFAIILRNDGGF